MNFERFGEYLYERSALLENDSLSPEKRKVLGRAIMEEEDDWFDWKVAREMLESWLGLREEVSSWFLYHYHYHDEQGNVFSSPLTGDIIKDIEIVLNEVESFLEKTR